MGHYPDERNISISLFLFRSSTEISDLSLSYQLERYFHTWSKNDTRSGLSDWFIKLVPRLHSDRIGRTLEVLLKCLHKPFHGFARVVKTSKKAQTFRDYK